MKFDEVVPCQEAVRLKVVGLVLFACCLKSCTLN